MILRSTIRPADPDDPERRDLAVECTDYATGRDQLYAHVPDGWKLLGIIVDH